MSFSFTSLVRLIVILGLSLTLLAIGLSKLDPSRPGFRSRVAARYCNLNEYFMNFADRAPRWLDAETGRVVSFPVEDGDVLEAASCSPWVDEKGQYQVVGRWSSRTRMGPMSISTDFGLARYSFPGGELLDHVSTDIVPVGPPAWFPGTKARVIFAGGDGELYRYAFEADPLEKGPDPAARRDACPTPLEWRGDKPGKGKVFLSDVSWPQDPRLTGYLVVALREQSPGPRPAHAFTGTSLWWLKLDYEGTEILEAGRLLVPGEGPGAGRAIDCRTPTVGTLPDGRAAVAYLTEGTPGTGWELRVTPIEFEGDQHTPRARASDSVVLSTGCQPAHPSFSADGRWLNAVGESAEPNGRLVRVPLSRLSPPSR